MRKNPLILHLTTGLEYGGTELRLARLLPRLNSFDHLVCSLKPRGPVAKAIESAGISVLSLELRSAASLPRAILVFAGIIRRHRPDIVITYLVHADVFARFFARAFGARRLVSFISSTVREPRYLWWSILNGLTSPLVDRFIAVSKTVKEHSVRHWSLPAAKVTVLPTGIDLKSVTLKDPGSYARKPRLLGTAGRLSKEKNLEFLLKVFKKILAGRPDLKLIIYGDGPQKLKLSQLARRLHLKKNVVFAGWKPDLKKRLSKLDLFLLPSSYEGLPNALLEAMAAGVPVVASDIPEHRSLIKHKKTGLLAPLDNLSGWSEAIEEVLGKAKLREDLAREARSFVEKDHSLSKTAKELEQFLKKLIGPRVLIIHPAPRAYRQEFFKKIAERLDVEFWFTDRNSLNYPDVDASQLNYKYRVFPEFFRSLGRGFCPTLPAVFLLSSRRFDVIISSGLWAYSSWKLFVLAKLTRKSFVLWDELWLWPQTLRYRLLKPYARVMARRSEALIAAGSQTKNLLVSLGGSTEKVFVVTNSTSRLSRVKLDQLRLRKIRKSLELDGKIVLLAVGRLVRYKNHDALLKAFALLKKSHSNIAVLLVGGGPERRRYRELIKKLALKDAHLIGEVSRQDLPYYYSMADIFVHPGRFMPKENVNCEAWGFVINEALGFGLPTVSTDSVGAAYDLIKNGDNGWRVEAGDHKALSQKIDALLKKPRLREEMGRASRKIVQRLTPQRAARVFLEVIRRAAK